VLSGRSFVNNSALAEIMPSDAACQASARWHNSAKTSRSEHPHIPAIQRPLNLYALYAEPAQ
jgi:hypothetical protein